MTDPQSKMTASVPPLAALPRQGLGATGRGGTPLDWRAGRHYTVPVFTGLVETTGGLAERSARGPGARLFIRATLAGEPLALGESITIDGACMSVVEIRPDGFAVDASQETLARTTLGSGKLEAGADRRVNLERALRVGDRLGGHMVSGHVDGVGALVERRAVGEATAMTRFVAEKGSIVVSGVSLTVNAVSPALPVPTFDVMLIPITLRVTNLGDLAPGDRVNLEVDLVARYVGAWLAGGPAAG